MRANFRDVADEVRRVGNIVLNAERMDDDVAAEIESLSSSVAWLDQQADMLAAAADDHMDSFGRGGNQRRFQLIFLIRCFLFCMELHD